MASATIESVLQEDRLFPPSPEFVKQANVSGAAAYQALCDEADRDFEGFWGRLAKEHVLWHKPFTRVLDESKAPFFKWFHDGELNASYNCLDRHLKTQGDKTAIIFEADDGKVTRITYRDRKSTRLNSSHDQISYAVFCLKKKNYRTSRETMGADGLARQAAIAQMPTQTVRMRIVNVSTYRLLI